jgi:hypothetical protein
MIPRTASLYYFCCCAHWLRLRAACVDVCFVGCGEHRDQRHMSGTIRYHCWVCTWLVQKGGSLLWVCFWSQRLCRVRRMVGRIFNGIADVKVISNDSSEKSPNRSRARPQARASRACALPLLWVKRRVSESFWREVRMSPGSCEPCCLQSQLRL